MQIPLLFMIFYRGRQMVCLLTEILNSYIKTVQYYIFCYSSLILFVFLNKIMFFDNIIFFNNIIIVQIDDNWLKFLISYNLLHSICFVGIGWYRLYSIYLRGQPSIQELFFIFMFLIKIIFLHTWALKIASGNVGLGDKSTTKGFLKFSVSRAYFR